MMQKEFLTVMAVLDDETQKRMDVLQQRVFTLGCTGTQTMGIPFHITLGSYPVDKENDLVCLMRETAGATAEFSISFDRLNTFSDRVLFLQPEANERLTALHRTFDCAYPDGFPWTPHATLFCGETEEVRAAKKEIETLSFPISARITAIELGRFFPARFIARYALTLETAAGKEALQR